MTYDCHYRPYECRLNRFTRLRGALEALSLTLAFHLTAMQAGRSTIQPAGEGTHYAMHWEARPDTPPEVKKWRTDYEPGKRVRAPALVRCASHAACAGANDAATAI